MSGKVRTVATGNPPPVSASRVWAASRIIPLLLVALVAFTSPARASDWIGDTGLAVGVIAVLGGFRNFEGGINSTEAVGDVALDVSLTLDADKSLGLREGTFYADLKYHGGRDPSKELVGDLQKFDNLNGPEFLQLYQLWYRQGALGDRLRIKVGKVDFNDEFDVIDNGLPFLNSSNQLTPTNFLLPTYPAPMPGISVFFAPDQFWHAGFGIAYANRSERFGIFTGHPQDAQPSEGGAYLVQELEASWPNNGESGVTGNFKIGVWEHTGTFTRFDRSRQQGTAGYYVILDQTLWRPPADRNGPDVQSFLEWGQTQDDITTIDRHFGGGITWKGLPTGRGDELGFALQQAHISEAADLPASHETAWEVFYMAELSPWLMIEPDLQYIVSPGGQYQDALVLTARLQITL
jgi:porin